MKLGKKPGTAVSESGGEKETAGGKWRVWYAPANLAVVTGQGKDEQEEGTDEDPASLFFEAETLRRLRSNMTAQRNMISTPDTSRRLYFPMHCSVTGDGWKNC